MPYIVSPNMNLIIPTVGLEAGPAYATDVNNSLTLIDSHNHSAGSGVPITPSGLNINSSLPMAGNFLTLTGAIVFQAQTLDSGVNSLYEKGVDLYYEDGSGNVIRITQGGSLAGAAGTITGLPSGTASASYATGAFVFQSATNTAAIIDGGSFILRNNTANSFGLTLAPPNALGANYQLTLPTIPAQTNVMTLDASGNMGSITYDQVGSSMSATGANAIAASMNATGANTIASTMTTTGADTIAAKIDTTGANAIASHIGSGQISGSQIVTNVALSGNQTTINGFFPAASLGGSVPWGIVQGTVNSGGTAIAGGISASHAGTGVYNIGFGLGFSEQPSAVALPQSATFAFATVFNVTSLGCQVRLWDDSFNPADIQFSIIAIGSRS